MVEDKMKKALISLNEPLFFYNKTSGLRIAEVVNENNTFEVHSSLIWVDCSGEVTAENYYYDNGEFKLIPIDPKSLRKPVVTLGE
jgi:hypothetical protein